MTFLLRAGIETCTLCGVGVGTGWQAKTAHVCARPHVALNAPVDDTEYCGNGHAYDDENTYISPDGSKRRCRRCDADRAQAARTSRVSRYGTTVFAPEQGRMESAKTNRPTRERRTVLSTPSDQHGKEAVDS
jgi:hypothetical protein